MSIITQGYGLKQLIVTQGYGYITVVVPIPGYVVPPRVHIVRIKETYLLPLSNLGLIERFKIEKILNRLNLVEEFGVETALDKLSLINKYSKKVGLFPLSIVSLGRIKTLLSELGVVLPTEVEMLIDTLIIASKTAGTISLGALHQAGKDQVFYQISTLSLADELKTYIQTHIPNIYALKLGERVKYLELLKLIERLDEIEIN